MRWEVDACSRVCARLDVGCGRDSRYSGQRAIPVPWQDWRRSEGQREDGLSGPRGMGARRDGRRQRGDAVEEQPQPEQGQRSSYGRAQRFK